MTSRKAFPLRIDPKLYEELETWAQQEFRSVNGQIEFLLRQAVLRRRRTGETAPDSPPAATDESAADAQK